MKSSDKLEQESGELEKDALLNEGIISEHLIQIEGMGEHLEALEFTTKAKKENASSINVSPELELKNLPTHLQYTYLEEG